MRFFVFVALALCFVAYSAEASVWGLGGTLVGPANPGAVLHGPAASASVIGPDGSHIVGGGQAGTVVAAPTPGGVVSGVVSPGVVGLGGWGGHGGVLWG